MTQETAVAVLDAPAPAEVGQPVADEALPETPLSPDVQDAGEETPPEKETVQPKSLPKSIDELSDDELREHPRFKDYVARQGESIRRTTQNETAKLIRADQARVAAGQNLEATLRTNIDGLVKHINEGGEVGADYAPRLAQLVAQAAWGFHSGAAVDWFNGAFASAMPADHKYSTAEMEQQRTLQEDVATGRAQASALFEFRLDQLKKAAVAEALPAEKVKWERERAKTERERAETERQREADEARDGQPRPTAASGGTRGPSFTTRTEAASLFAEGRISNDQYRRAQALPW